MLGIWWYMIDACGWVEVHAVQNLKLMEMRSVANMWGRVGVERC